MGEEFGRASVNYDVGGIVIVGVYMFEMRSMILFVRDVITNSSGPLNTRIKGRRSRDVKFLD